MKYKFETIIYMLFLFFLTQFIGLIIVFHYDVNQLPYGFKEPEVSNVISVNYLLFGVLLMSFIFYWLVKFNFNLVIKLWFSLSVLISLMISFNVFFNEFLSFFVALVLTIIRVNDDDLIIHNFTELFIYGGIVSIFKPLFNPFSALILLFFISIYDYISVFVTKHMVYLAKSQGSLNLFTGLVVKNKGDTSILGGGDIAFSLLFTAVLSVRGLIYSYINIYFVLIAVALLMFLGHRGKFYPAMPFITSACAVSYLISL